MQVLTQNGFKSFDGILDKGTSENLLEITYNLDDSSESLKCTYGHRVLMSDGSFLEAEFLEIGMELSGGYEISDITELDDNENVYDLLNVQDTSSYYTNGIISHNCLMLDEFAFIHPNMADEFFTSVYPTISSGSTSKTIIISTPNGYNHFYRLWNEAIQGTNGFVPKLYTWRDHPERNQKWADDQRNVLGELKYNQEVECEFLGSSNTLINSNVIRTMSADKPLFQTQSLQIYREVEDKHNYIIIADTSRGKELDYSAFIVFDVTEYPIRIVAKFRDNKISPQLYPGIIYKLAKQYNDAQVLVEVNDNGQEVANILHNDYEYDNMVSLSFHSREFGIRTDKKVKRIGCTNFRDLVETQKLIINDAELISEISTFVQHKESYAASVGAHDDLVMCCVLLAWFSSTNMFKDIFNMDIRKKLHDDYMKSVEDDVLPFGIIDDGLIEDSDFQEIIHF